MSARFALVLLFACAAGGSLLGDEITDRQIERDAARSWRLQDELGGRVQISASDGVVRLTGRVETVDQKEVAVTAVGLIPYVRSVDDQIRVGGPKVFRSDAWIMLHLKAQLLTHRDVSAAHTGVTVRDGEVILSGPAATSAQKELTERYARGVEGVRAVVNDMSIAAEWPRLSSRSTFAGDGPAASPAKDAAIAAGVRAALQRFRIDSGSQFRVSSENGDVRLNGMAYNEDEREFAVRAANTVPGVREVIDDLRVRGQ